MSDSIDVTVDGSWLGQMSTNGSRDEAVELLQQLGLKEYEARCFVGLTQLSTGTAKQLSELTEVPRTRVYDAIRMLEANGLVEIQHSSPQQFRAVPLPEAIETLRDQYEERVQRLEDALTGMDSVDVDDAGEVYEIWSLSGQQAITNRTNQLLDEATEEVVFIIGDERLLTGDLIDSLNALPSGIRLLVGTVSESLASEARDAIPNATTFISGLGWLQGDSAEDTVGIGRLVLVDRETILVSTLSDDTDEENAIYGTGFHNGLVVIARRLMEQGFIGDTGAPADS